MRAVRGVGLQQELVRLVAQPRRLGHGRLPLGDQHRHHRGGLLRHHNG